MPDNNLIESAIRPVAVGRRSYLFLGGERGGHVAATMYSLIGTCRLNGVEPGFAMFSIACPTTQ
jgi:hypothetical protein